jgi:hypothetical protein
VYVNTKMIPVETIPGIGRREIKQNCGGGEFKYGILDMLYELSTCYNVPPPSTTIREKKNIETENYSCSE